MDYNLLSEKIIGYRRDLHQIPELGYKEYKTREYILNIVKSFDCKIFDVAQTGMLCFFDFGKTSSLAFRCDMDALPIAEQTGLPFASKHAGTMHACGHDGHMAMMLGFMHVINEIKASGKSLPNNILCIFQPAEEIILGALDICNSKVLDQFNIKAIFGTHLWPILPKGQINSIPGAMMAKSTEVNVLIEGLSSHAGEPHKGRDSLEAAAMFITTAFRLKKETLPANTILKFGKMTSGNVRNAISPRTEINGTMRTFDEESWDKIVEIMENTGKMIEKDYGVTFTLDVSHSHPCVVNDVELYNKIKPTLQTLNYNEMAEPVKIAEDFSFYQKILPGVFFHLGTGCTTPLHSVDYMLDEEVLIDGVKLFESLAKIEL